VSSLRAPLVERAQDWPWSSVRAHLEGRDDRLVEAAPLLARSAGGLADLLDDECTKWKMVGYRWQHNQHVVTMESVE